MQPLPQAQLTLPPLPLRESSGDKIVVETLPLTYFVGELRAALERGDDTLVRWMIDNSDVRFDDNYIEYRRAP